MDRPRQLPRAASTGAPWRARFRRPISGKKAASNAAYERSVQPQVHHRRSGKLQSS
jgi:hypothetical protein